MVRKLAVILGAAALWPASVAWAQLAPPNQAGVAMGHLHYHVRDVDLARQFWTALGGLPMKVGTTDVMTFPGVLVFLTRAEPSGGSVGSVLNHVAFQVPNTEPTAVALKAAGHKVERSKEFPLINAFTPDGDLVEVFDQLTENSKFTPEQGQIAEHAQRLNRKMAVPITSHHVHLFVPEGADAEAQAWYVRTFGGVPGMRWHYKAVDLPGINLNFSTSTAVQAPTRGRTVDHIGFEVTNLEAFCRRLQASGMTFDVPYTQGADGFATALVTDPWGTSIELTEGLRQTH